MVIKFKQKGLTEQEIINLPKVNKRCIYIGEEDVFLKKGKDNIINLGSKELFRDIHNIFNFDTATEIHLFLALCGHEEATEFKGDPYKTVEKLVEGVMGYNRGENYKRYISLSREERKELPLYSKRTRRRIESRGYIECEIKKIQKRIQSKDSIWRFEKEDLEKYQKVVGSLNNDIFDILEQGKYSIIQSSIGYISDEDEEITASEHYKKLSDSLFSNAWRMFPGGETYSTFGLKVKHIRDKDNMGNSWVVEKQSYFDVKTGELEAHLTDGLVSKEISLNLYKDDISKSKYKHEVPISILLEVVLRNYKKSKTNIHSSIIMNIVRQTLLNEKYRCYINTTDKNIYERISFDGGYKIVGELGYRENYLETVALVVKNIDKIINLEEYELFEKHSYLINIPKKPKWKVPEALCLTKQTYKKLLTLNEFEQKNYLRFARNLWEFHNHLHTEINLHKLFDDTFLMVQNSSTVTNSLEMGSEVHEVLDITFSDYKKMVHYLDVDVPDRQRITGYARSSYYIDYIYDLAILVREGYRTVESVNLTPFSLKLEHDIVTDEKSSIQKELDDKELKNKYNNKLTKILNKSYKLKDGSRVKLLPADTVSKLKEEGKMLSHCVGGYANKIIKGKCLILLARLEHDIENSWYTVEIRITGNGYVLGQQQSIKTYKLPNELRVEIEKDIKTINKELFKEAS